MATNQEIRVFEDWIDLERSSRIGQIIDILSEDQKKTLLGGAAAEQKQVLLDSKKAQEDALIEIDKLIEELDKPSEIEVPMGEVIVTP